ncbi:hypothetical protein V8B97DRAFT_1869400 [Scleroderma yunnanense]
MPSTLRRSRRRELTLTRSFTNAICDKIHPDHRFLAEIRDHRLLLTGFPNVRSRSQIDSMCNAGSPPALISRPPMVFSLHRNPNHIIPSHPIHRLPLELLIHVFVLGSFDDAMFPVLVSHVCHPWRTIALQTHTLWRRIVLTQHSDLTMWQERLRRARSCTLDVVLASHPSSSMPHDIDVVALQMHMVAPHLARTRSIDVHLDEYTPYLWNITLGPLCSTCYHWGVSPGSRDPNYTSSKLAPRLESLSLRYPRNDDTKEFTLFDGLSPCLSRLTVEGVRLTWLPGLFGSLKCLDYTHHGFTSGRAMVDEILSMLQVSYQLRELRLCFASKMMEAEILCVGGRPAVEEVVTLPFLETLSLRVKGTDVKVPTELVSIISRMSLPMLKKLNLCDSLLAIHSPWNHDTVQFAGLPTFFDIVYQQARQSPMTDISVEGRWVDVPLLVGFGRSFPSLRTIKINGTTRVVWFNDEMLVPTTCV